MIYVSQIQEERLVNGACTIQVSFVATKHGDTRLLYQALRQAGDQHGWEGADSLPLVDAVSFWGDGQ